jgi:stearoyl-CoA desaturase (Delta-9 desaturase)
LSTLRAGFEDLFHMSLRMEKVYCSCKERNSSRLRKKYFIYVTIKKNLNPNIMTALTFLSIVCGWWLCGLFFHSTYLHRFGVHDQFSASPFWQGVFLFLTWIFQGPAFLHPDTYRRMHAQHHDKSDTKDDPHSPNFFRDVFQMTFEMKRRFTAIKKGEDELSTKFEESHALRWEWFENFADHKVTVITTALLYTWFYYLYAPLWAWPLLPISILNGPIQGAIVNWWGHKVGYRNFEEVKDNSRNTYFPFNFFMLGELFQNNHHKYPSRVNFGVKWYEIDLAYWILVPMHILHIIRFKNPPAYLRWS